MTEQEPIMLAERRRIKGLIPLKFHPKANWLPSDLQRIAKGSQENALRKAKRNFGEKMNLPRADAAWYLLLVLPPSPAIAGTASSLCSRT
jgi:hypothetical protein